MNFFRTTRGRIVALVALVVVIGGAAAVGALTLKADQDAAVAKYGAQVVNLCKTVAKADSVSLSGNAKIAVFNADLSTIFESYQEAFARTNQASGKDDVTHVICLSSAKSTYDTDSYGNGKYTCTRYQQNYDVYVVDVKTGKTVSYQQAQGATPPVCPDTASENLTRYGDYPAPADIVSAVGLSHD